MKRERCRACESANLRQIHDFGPQPLAGQYPTVPESVRPAKRYTLDLTECEDCGLWQVTNLPPIHEIFHSDYRYSSSTVPSLVQHFAEYADFLTARLPPGASVFEFGCNDGVLLTQMRTRGFRCIGIDASDNVAALAREKGLEVHTGFLTPDFVLAKGLASVFDQVTCSNVFAHIDDIGVATRAVKMLLKPGGLFTVEVHDGEVLAGECQFDTVYHEHLTYFTEDSLKACTARQGFEFVECHRTPMHGGGLRFSARLGGGTPGETTGGTESPSLDARRLGEAIARCRKDIERLYDIHGPIDGYGAAGRAQMFINITGTAHCFRRVFDDSHFRQGRYIVGTDIPIVPFRQNGGSCCAILAWNYAPAIAKRIEAYFSEIVTLLPTFERWGNR
jgi:SAM-dependent methyltransferase